MKKLFAILAVMLFALSASAQFQEGKGYLGASLRDWILTITVRMALI